MDKKMSAKEFRDQGYLQELNRIFLHPLGLALEVVIEEDGSERFGEVWDSRTDPEGILFNELTGEERRINATRIRREREMHQSGRETRLKDYATDVLLTGVQAVGHYFSEDYDKDNKNHRLADDR